MPLHEFVEQLCCLITASACALSHSFIEDWLLRWRTTTLSRQHRILPVSDVLSHALCFLPLSAATPLFAIHNTVHNWEAPAQYRPERWLDVPVEAYVYDSTTNTTGGEYLPDAAGLQKAAPLLSSVQSHTPSLQAVLLSKYYWQPVW
jgi:hypothetical protein